MKKTMIALSMLVAGASAAAAAPCADRDYVVNALETRFGETRTLVSLVPNQNIIEVFQSEETARWTVLVSLPSEGLTCMVATGRGYASLEARLENDLDNIVLARR